MKSRLSGRKPAGWIGVFTILVFNGALLPLGTEVDLGLHGTVETLYAVPFSRTPGLSDGRSAFTGELTARAGAAAAFVSLSGEYNGISPGDRTGFSPGEAWVDWSAGDFKLRLGRQLLSWGVADGIILTDVVCPQNLTAYAGLDFAGSRVAVDGLRLRYSFPAFAVDALWIPLFSPAKLPGDPQNPLYGIFSSPPSVDLGGRILPVSVSPAAPPRTIADGEYGLRLSFYTSALDFSFAGFYGWNDVPQAGKELILSDKGEAAGIALSPVYGRTLTLGADAGIPLGEILLRLETAWTGGGRYDRSAGESAAALLSGQADDPLTMHNLKALAGIDWNPHGWTLSVQYYEDLLPEARGGGTGRPWRKNGLSLRIARGLFRETLNL
ncbi:MAG: hypothetical protein LBP71_02360, partial [Spirochaetaceae bacterium]|nr:hypothetical protein [Spirochaetaceae bacterium]